MIPRKLVPLFIKKKPFFIEEASHLLEISKKDTAHLLYRLSKANHIKNIKPGLYFPVSDKSLLADEAISDPWILVPYVFPSCYIGGWSALNYWGLTDQLYLKTAVFRNSNTVTRNRSFIGYEYALFKSILCVDIGNDIVWRENINVPISDVHKTVIDVINAPISGGGVYSVAESLKTYFEEFYDEGIFINYLESIENNTFFKKLGFFVDFVKGPHHTLCNLSKKRISKGYTYLVDKDKNKKLITRWNLFVEEDIKNDYMRRNKTYS